MNNYRNNFIFQIIKKEKENNIQLEIYSLDTFSKTHLNRVHIPYQIFLKKNDFDSLKVESDKIILSEECFYNKNEEEVLRLTIFNKEIYDYLKKQIKELNFDTYEDDLNPEHRYLIDYDVDIFSNKSNQIPKLKYISFDIETVGDYENQEIIMISTHSNQNKSFNKVYINKDKIAHNKLKDTPKNYSIIQLKDEQELLQVFKDDIIKSEVQVILGWNVIDFDFNIIRDRMKYYNLDFKFSQFQGENKLRINKDFFTNSSLHIPGVLVFDVIHLLKANYIIFDDYKLNTVAKEVLKDEKIQLDLNPDETFEEKINTIQKLSTQDPQKLIEYNFKDSELTTKITEKLGLLELIMQRSIITNTPLMKVKSPIASLDLLYLKELHKQKIVAPTNNNFKDTSQLEGAYVIDPKQGFYENIFVFDFKSLYPSIIMTFNIDPYTYNPNNGTIQAPNGAKFVKQKGILPTLIYQIYKERDIAKSQKDDIKSYALKTTMNSFWGAIASPKSRFYNSEIAGAITGFARHVTKKAEKYANKSNKVIYGDTDSIFVKIPNLKKTDLDSLKKAGYQLEKELNKHFNDWIDKEYQIKNFLNIELEKIYDKFFIASKKRYVGRDILKNKIQFVGMEAIRGDWTQLARSFQINLVNLIFSNKKREEIEKYILNYIQKLKSGKFDDKLVYTKKITKPLNQYTKTTPPHVKAARELKNFNRRTVKYVMGEKGPKHISLISDNFKYDYEHYIEKQLKGVSDDLLESLGIDFDNVILMKKQTRLDNFF
ncbi:MAG: DNA polymerase domain-containing protein [Nanoarchaeota archaeon]